MQLLSKTVIVRTSLHLEFSKNMLQFSVSNSLYIYG